MANIITRRSILAGSAGMAALAAGGEALAQSQVRGDSSVAAPRLAIENGATLRILRPVRADRRQPQQGVKIEAVQRTAMIAQPQVALVQQGLCQGRNRHGYQHGQQCQAKAV